MMGDGFGGGWMWLFGLLLLLGLSLLVVVAVRALAGGIDRARAPRPGERNRARELLDERYARGELTTDEYWERRRHLAGGG
jgi:putative membrane protein